MFVQECHYENAKKCQVEYKDECEVTYNYGKQCKKVPVQNCSYVKVGKKMFQLLFSFIYFRKRNAKKFLRKSVRRCFMTSAKSCPRRSERRSPRRDVSGQKRGFKMIPVARKTLFLLLKKYCLIKSNWDFDYPSWPNNAMPDDTNYLGLIAEGADQGAEQNYSLLCKHHYTQNRVIFNIINVN